MLALAMVGLGAFGPSDGAAQEADDTAVLTGTVVSAVTGTPLAHVDVALERAGRSTRTDSAGQFTLRNLRAGIDTIRLDRTGIATQQMALRLTAGRVTRAIFRVSETVIQMADIEVTVPTADRLGRLSGFERRRQKGYGSFLTHEEIEGQSPRRTSDLFRRVPGVRVGLSGVDGASVQIGRRTSVSHCRPRIYLDGVPRAGLRVDDVDWRAILGIEIYRGPAETPPLFKFRGGACGTIVIWTKGGADES